MDMANLDQAPHNTTLMGVLRGVVDYCGLDISDATLYGSSGHAFVINIHAELCPSGPYCWDLSRQGRESDYQCDSRCSRPNQEYR